MIGQHTVSSDGNATTAVFSVGGGLQQSQKTGQPTESSDGNATTAVFPVGGGLQKSQTTGQPTKAPGLPGTPYAHSLGSRQIKNLVSQPCFQSPIGVPIVQNESSLANTPHSIAEDPLENLSMTPEVLPDIVFNENYSPIEEWTANLSKETPARNEDSILSDIKTPTPSNSPFWVVEDQVTPKTPVNPMDFVEATYSRPSTPAFHGPTHYFSKRLRQKIFLSRQGKSKKTSEKPSNVVFSLEKQRLIATTVKGIARMDKSNDSSTKN